MDEFVAVFGRVWNDIAGGVHAPMSFRVIVQPLVAAVFAIRAGRMDARQGRPLYFWALLGDAARRHERLREGWQHVGKVFIAAVIVDAIYQVIVEHWIYPSEALMVGLILAVLPYLVFRGIVNRLLRGKVRAAH